MINMNSNPTIQYRNYSNQYIILKFNELNSYNKILAL